LACECLCVACNTQLSAKKGITNAHHFAHFNANECPHAFETALHLAAKKVLEESASIALPELIITETIDGEICGQRITKIDQAKVGEMHVAKIDYVVLEKRLHNIIPDVIAYINGQPLIIEIAVTHFVDANKESKLHNLDIASIEIDLSNVVRDIDFETIRSIVVNSIAEKSWIFHPKTEIVRTELRSILEMELQTELNQIYQKEQERLQQEAENRQRKLATEEKERRSIQLIVSRMKIHAETIGSLHLSYAEVLSHSPIWRRVANNMSISIEDLPDCLNQPVKGEYIFACDRRAWQAGLFSAFIYKKIEKYATPYPISIKNMVNWCKKYVPLNQFALPLWPKKDQLQFPELKLLYDFNLYGAVREFAKHLEREGFIKYACRDYFNIVIDKLPICSILENSRKAMFIDVSEDDFLALSTDELERYQERAGIYEFCGGVVRKEAEKLAYLSLFN